jgi:hypothetical protein
MTKQDSGRHPFDGWCSKAVEDAIYWGVTGLLALGQLILIGIVLGFILWVASCTLAVL